MGDTVAERALSVAYRIKDIPERIIESFKSADTAQRKRDMTSIVQEIAVDLAAVLSWIERNRHPASAQLEYRRIAWLQHEVPEIVALDIEQYRGGVVRDALPGERPTEGVRRTAELTVFCLMFAAKLGDWSEDIASIEGPRIKPPVTHAENSPMTIEFDVFMSHASEDKADVAEPLSIALGKTKRVWLDKGQIRGGNYLQAKIDEGLGASRFAVAIFSEAFFNKTWAKRELAALLSLEDDGKERIIPVLHGITIERLRKFSPIMASRLCLNTNKSIAALSEEILAILNDPPHEVSKHVAPPPASPVPEARPRPFVDGTKSPGINLPYDDLDEHAKKFLLLADDGDKFIRAGETEEGYVVRVGGQEFAGEGLAYHRMQQEYKESVRKLFVGRYIEQIGNSKAFQISYRGYKKIDDLRVAQ